MTAPADASSDPSRSISWNSTRRALNCRRTDNGTIDFDGYRREKLARLAEHTKRPAIVYAVDFMNPAKPSAVMALRNDDLAGLQEVLRGLSGHSVDLVLHSPGGSPEAAESLVATLRRSFDHVRAIVPVMAKSAATMVALAADEIVMPFSAELGPIDPQLVVGNRMTPAQAIIDEVERARVALQAGAADVNLWLAKAANLPAGLYQVALNSIDLSKRLVREWLTKYMFAGDAQATSKAEGVADFLGDHNKFLTHGRRVSIDDLASREVRISDIKQDPALACLVEDVWYAIDHTFRGTGLLKMWENSNGVGLFNVQQQIIVAQAQMPGQEVQQGPGA